MKITKIYWCQRTPQKGSGSALGPTGPPSMSLAQGLQKLVQKPSFWDGFSFPVWFPTSILDFSTKFKFFKI